MIHLVGLIIDDPYIPVHLLRSIRYSVHNSFHISLHCRDGSLEIMGNITDQLFILLIQNKLLLRRILQSPSHLLEVSAQLGKFIRPVHFQSKIKISFFDILRGSS